MPYPGLAAHPTHQEALALFEPNTSFSNGFGAMVTFDLKSNNAETQMAACEAFHHAIKNHVAYVPTLGDADSIFLHVGTVFTDAHPDKMGTIRFSAGIEPTNQLVQQVLKAHDAIDERLIG